MSKAFPASTQCRISDGALLPLVAQIDAQLLRYLERSCRLIRARAELTKSHHTTTTRKKSAL